LWKSFKNPISLLAMGFPLQSNLRREQLEQSSALWDEAKRIESQLPALRQAAFARVKASHTGIRYRSWGVLRTVARTSKVAKPYFALVREEAKAIDSIAARAAWCRKESDRLGEMARAADHRRILDPDTDPIPAGPYQKLRDCSQYPLRLTCNEGDLDSVRWPRCKFMTFDRAGPDGGWICVAPRV